MNIEYNYTCVGNIKKNYSTIFFSRTKTSYRQIPDNNVIISLFYTGKNEQIQMNIVFTSKVCDEI